MSRSAGQNHGRNRFRGALGAALFVVAILVLFGGWSGLWHWASGRLSGEIDAGLQQLASRGVAVECAGRNIRGFPFRIGIFCDGVSANAGGGRISAGALRSAAQAYQPGRAVIELDGPAEIEIPRRPKLSLSWTSARASVLAGLSGLRRGSVELRNAGLLVFGVRPLARAADLQGHARRAQEPDSIEIAASASALHLLQPAEAGPFDIEFQALLDPAPASLDELLRAPSLPARLRRDGLRGTIHHLRLAIGESSLVVSGPFEMSTNGELSGRFELMANRPEDLLRAVGSLLRDEDEIRAFADQLAIVLSLAGERTEATLVIDRGAARIGIVPLGKLPRLF